MKTNERPKFPTDPLLIEALNDLRTEQDLTNDALGKYFGKGGTFISKYLNSNLDQDPKDFAERAWETIKAIRGRLDLAHQLFETSVSRSIAGRIETARRTQDVCLISSPAGQGKTSACKLYALANKSTIYTKLNGQQRSAAKLESLIFGALETRTWKGNTSRWDYIVAALKGSSRALIVDNAHRLDTGGRNLLFDLNEETGCAIILVGNPEILDRIRSNDQQFSRVGVKGEAELTKKEIPSVAQRVAEQFSDAEFAEQVGDLAAFVASKPGHLRAVRKRVILAQEILAKKPDMGGRAAFRAAHSNLVSDYMLPSD